MIDLNNMLNASLFIMFFSILFSTYGLYLSWKQSKVKDGMEVLINEVKQIKEVMFEWKK